MAREIRTGRPAGPGRKPRRPRTGARSGASASAPAQAGAAAPTRTPLWRIGSRTPGQPGRQAQARRPLAFTRRALVLAAVLLVLSVSYVGSLRVYLTQQNELAVARQQIEERSSRVAQLEQEAQRWRDPAYVKAQARARLGWVMPGEVGYRVIGRDGTVLSGQSEIQGVGTRQKSALDPRWWDQLAGSIQTADDPRVVKR